VSKNELGKVNRHNFLTSLKLLLQPQKLGDLLVSKGHLSSDTLQYALIRQESDRTRLGRILIQQRLASRRTVYGTLARQWTLRCAAAFLTFAVSLSSHGIRTARAAALEDVPGHISLVSTANTAFAPVHAYPALFGTEEKPSKNITPFTKWSGMFVHFATDVQNPKYHAALDGWKNSLRPLKGRSIEDMAKGVNDLMNARPYIEDMPNYGISDYWADPLEFLTRGGDCEDFAIAKYASLRMLGVPEDRLRVSIVKDMQKGIAHAILIVYTDTDALILDNQSQQVRSSTMVSRYQPIFSINREGWWLHKAPTSTVVASAQ